MLKQNKNAKSREMTIPKNLAKESERRENLKNRKETTAQIGKPIRKAEPTVKIESRLGVKKSLIHHEETGLTENVILEEMLTAIGEENVIIVSQRRTTAKLIGPETEIGIETITGKRTVEDNAIIVVRE